jgi:hypothetical protein
MNFRAISEVSRFLRRTLFLGFSEDQALLQHVPSEAAIVLSNPGDPAPVEARRLSLWLYQVVPNEHLRNAPMMRQPNDDVEAYPPLALTLYYLLTPSTGSDEGDQIILGRALQIFHDSSILTLESQDEPGTGEELHLSLVQRTIEEVAQVWEALQQPYRLSVCYEVRVVRIDSRRVLTARRVGERTSDFRPAPAGASA